MLVAAVAFVVPALRRSGAFVPLDDTYIHFAFARSLATGGFFESSPGNGYSSGATSWLYPLLLAPGWLAGFRGERLAWWSLALAVAAIVDLSRSLRALLPHSPWIGRWVAPFVVVCVPLLDWHFFSGMETAVLAALVGRACVAMRDVERAPAAARPSAQLRLGLLLAAILVTRPEGFGLAFAFAIAAAHAGRSLGALGSLARAGGPSVLLVAARACVDRVLTGDAAPAGALRKLVWSEPFASPADVGIELVKNAVVVERQAFEVALGGAGVLVVVLALGGTFDRTTRRLASALLFGTAAWSFAALQNATARFQNFRYAAPVVLLLLVAAVLGLAALEVRSRVAALALAAVVVLAPCLEFPKQILHFTRASANIEEQQVALARRFAARPGEAKRIFVNDVGALSYLSGARTLDGLGLGGYHDLPFARASMHGVASVVELVERMPVADRPDVLAVYPGWWQGVVDAFGRPVDRVRIEDNVICGAAEVVVYRADWSALAAPGERVPGEVDALDEADLVDERAHGYSFATPRAGYTVLAVLGDPMRGGSRRFDAGRVFPQGAWEAFDVGAGVGPGAAHMVLRTDGAAAAELEVQVRGPGIVEDRVASIARRQDGSWHDVDVPLADVRTGTRVTIAVRSGSWRSFHAWLVRREGIVSP